MLRYKEKQEKGDAMAWVTGEGGLLYQLSCVKLGSLGKF